MSSGHFDEKDRESWYFGALTSEEANHLLLPEDDGVFLVRDSSRGGLVICVKESGEVSQYRVTTKEVDNETKFMIRDEWTFRDFHSLLSFYKRNLFRSTALLRPVTKDNVDNVNPRARQNGAALGRHTLTEENSAFAQAQASKLRQSAPPNMNRPAGTVFNECPPVYARVIKTRDPSPYGSDLKLSVGDIIRVTSRKDGKGQGELNGKKGSFPLTHVELIEPADG